MIRNGGDMSREERRRRRMIMMVAGPPDALEWLLGTLKVVFGLWMLMPFSMFATAPRLYIHLSWLPEWVYGLAFLLLGIAQWVAWDYDAPKARYFIGVLAALLWDYWGLMIFRADPRTSALVFLTVIALGQLAAVVWLYDRAFPRANSVPDDSQKKG